MRNSPEETMKQLPPPDLDEGARWRLLRTAALKDRPRVDFVIESICLGQVETITTVGKTQSRSVAPLSIPRVRWLERS